MTLSRPPNERFGVRLGLNVASQLSATTRGCSFIRVSAVKKLGTSWLVPAREGSIGVMSCLSPLWLRPFHIAHSLLWPPAPRTLSTESAPCARPCTLLFPVYSL
eukprot:5741285-Pyramimonas_sp.AAC.1